MKAASSPPTAIGSGRCEGPPNRDDAYGFVGAINAAILTTDSVGDITYANAACEKVFGYQPGGLVGLNVRVIVPPRFHGPHSSGMKALVDGGTPRLSGKTVEVTAIRRDGTEIAIELSLSNWRIDGAMRIGAMIRDISERRSRDARLLRLAHHDSRSGLPNRNHVVDELAIAMQRGRSATVLAVSMDGLRSVNDTLGHDVGDSLLESIVVRLRAHLDADACSLERAMTNSRSSCRIRRTRSQPRCVRKA